MSKLNEEGKIEIKEGRKVIARIYNRPVFFKGRAIRYPEQYPYNLELSYMGISRECETLQEVDKYLYTHTGKHVPDDEMPIPEIQFTRVNSDYLGNPRYVCHYVNFLTDSDRNVTDSYELALTRAKKLGGRKYHNKSYGGGIVFQTYNLPGLNKDIHELLKGLK